MMHQSDLPLFGYLRRNQFNEAVRQAGEMERLIRSHPSSVMVTYINEPFSADKRQRKPPVSATRARATSIATSLRRSSSRHHAVRLERIPTAWSRTSRATTTRRPRRPIGLPHLQHVVHQPRPAHRHVVARLPARAEAGWKTGCGEYGTEGLDPLDVMLNGYPKDWVPKALDQPWTPEKIVRSQSYTMHGDWYEEQTPSRTGFAKARSTRRWPPA